MTTRALVASLALVVTSSAASGPAASAQDTTPEGLTLALTPPAREIRVDDRFEVELRLGLPEGEGDSPLPLLVTPSAEGNAVEVVRGRLLRADAEDPAAHPLVLRIPLVARRAGTAVVRVRVRTFVCEEGRCEPVLAESSIAISVRPAGAAPGHK